jgi:hypothetical protein
VSKPTGENPDAVQIEPTLPESLDAMRKTNLRKRGASDLACKRDGCGQVLCNSYGDHLDCFAFTIWEPVRLKCERCGFETKWRPGPPTAYNAELNPKQPIDGAANPK